MFFALSCTSKALSPWCPNMASVGHGFPSQSERSLLSEAFSVLLWTLSRRVLSGEEGGRLQGPAGPVCKGSRWHPVHLLAGSPCAQ